MPIVQPNQPPSFAVQGLLSLQPALKDHYLTLVDEDTEQLVGIPHDRVLMFRIIETKEVVGMDKFPEQLYPSDATPEASVPDVPCECCGEILVESQTVDGFRYVCPLCLPGHPDCILNREEE